MIFSFDANASSNVPIQTVSLTQPMYFLRLFLDLMAPTKDGIDRYKVSPDFGNIGRYIFYNSWSPVTHRSRREAVTSFLLRMLVFWRFERAVRIFVVGLADVATGLRFFPVLGCFLAFGRWPEGGCWLDLRAHFVPVASRGERLT
jgi:hypothetical protein